MIDFDTANEVYSIRVIHTPVPGAENTYVVQVVCDDAVVREYIRVWYTQINSAIRILCDTFGMDHSLFCNDDYNNLLKLRKMVPSIYLQY